MNLDKKQKTGIALGMLLWTGIQLILYIIKINNVSDILTVGIMTAAGIIFVVSINIRQSRIGSRLKVVLSVLSLMLCIFTAVGTVILDMNDQQFQNYKNIYLIIVILDVLSFFALIVSFGILYMQMTKKS